MSRIVGPITAGPTTGGAGVSAATGEINHAVYGRVLSIWLDYKGVAAPATTDVVVKTKGSNAPSVTLLTRTDASADGLFHPRHLLHDEAGVALIGTAGGDREPFAIDDVVQVTIAQANDGVIVDAYLMVE